jgi:rare lipoprotein A
MLFSKKILTILACTSLGLYPNNVQAAITESSLNSPSRIKTEWEQKIEKKFPHYNIPLASVYRGEASWYGPGFYGNRTANGEVYRPGSMTAAHPNLPFGTRVKVTNLNNGRSEIVRINDRGPYVGGRIIDLSETAANSLGMLNSGVAPVKIQILR